MDRNRKLIALDIVQMHLLKGCNFTKSLLQIFSTQSENKNIKRNRVIIFNLYTKDIVKLVDKEYLKNKLCVINHIYNKNIEVQNLINLYELNTKLNENISILLS